MYFYSEAESHRKNGTTNASQVSFTEYLINYFESTATGYFVLSSIKCQIIYLGKS